jgi:anaerobic selenocysteine-containing dehydrogenase
MTRIVPRTCNLCEALCGMLITVQDGTITSVRPDPDDPFSRGHICPKGPALKEIYEDPDRLRQPMRRTAAGFVPVSWEEALTEAAARLNEIRAQHGKDAIGVYIGNPTVHNHGLSMTVPGFLRTLHTRNRFDANSQDANPRLYACMLLYGDQLSIPVPDVDRTRYLLMFGANPAASGGSLMTLGDVRGRLRGIRERGGRIVLFDPRRTETAAWCDEHHALRPGGDAALLCAMLHVLFAEGLTQKDRDIETRAKGLPALKQLAGRFPPERVAQAVGVPAEVIRRVSREFAAAESAIAYGRLGACLNPFGPVACWLLDALNVVTGNFDRPGGVMFPRPAADTSAIGRKLIGNHHGRWRSRVRGLPEFAGQLPAAVMAEEIETPGPGQIRAFITIAGNPVLSTPNGERLGRALSTLPFLVSIDPYINETTRHAHLILPPVHTLERGHFDLVFNTFAVRNTVKYSPPVVPPPPDGKEDWEILYDLGMRLGGLRMGHPLADRAARLLYRAGVRVSPDRMLDLLLRLGPYRLSLAKVRRHPHGLDLGPLTPAGRAKVHTRDGLVDLAPAPLLEDAARIDAWLGEQQAAAGGLVLIGRRHVRNNNSWMHNAPTLARGRDRATLLIHPEDARRLGVTEGALCRIRSRVGEVSARAELTEDVRQGVVSLPHGFGHQAAAATLRVAGALPGPNINALTDEAHVEPLLGTAILNGVPVQISPQEAGG